MTRADWLGLFRTMLTIDAAVLAPLWLVWTVAK